MGNRPLRLPVLQYHRAQASPYVRVSSLDTPLPLRQGLPAGGEASRHLGSILAQGRDLYDLVWYLADRTWPAPNLSLLKAAPAQTGWKGSLLTEANWRKQVRRRIVALDWENARTDVHPFLERERDLDLVTKEVPIHLLASE